MTLKTTMTALLLLGILLVGCGRGAAEMALDEAAMAPMADVEMVEMEAYAEESAAGVAFRDDAQFNEAVLVAQDTAQERIIIRTADMSIVVVDTEAAMDTISQMVNENGGWVVQSSVFQYSDDAMTGNMNVRIPSEGFDSFLEAVRHLSVEVNHISTSGQDVTEEYVDLSARLANLEATADRVRSFLDETKSVEEALAVNRELSRLEGDIEALKGRLQYLEQSAAFSSILIDLTPDMLSQPIEVGGWQPQGVARSAVQTLIATLQTLADIAIWLTIYVLPLALVLAIPAWLLIRFFRRRRAGRQVEADVVPPQESENR